MPVRCYLAKQTTEQRLRGGHHCALWSVCTNSSGKNPKMFLGEHLDWTAQSTSWPASYFPAHRFSCIRMRKILHWRVEWGRGYRKNFLIRQAIDLGSACRRKTSQWHFGVQISQKPLSGTQNENNSFRFLRRLKVLPNFGSRIWKWRWEALWSYFKENEKLSLNCRVSNCVRKTTMPPAN